MTRVGFIDSGVAPRHLPSVERSRAFRLRWDSVEGEDGGGIDTLGHGSALADVLTADKRTRLIVARVFVDKLKTTAAQVAAAFDWMTVNRVPLITVSAGVGEDRDLLRDAVARSTAVGTLIVAAAPARGDPVYPAFYEGVVRATGDARCAPGEVSWLGTRYADFGAHVRAGDVQGASAGCAWVTARIATLRADGLSFAQAVMAMRRTAPHQGPEHREA